ncbi:hypothetical protein EDD16DRAFT_699309 [Pisolithus croceorrhizus]|nr:hypothetical protein EDD16DRAFT_699309 [Pisolithus croceorrhizus]
MVLFLILTCHFSSYWFQTWNHQSFVSGETILIQTTASVSPDFTELTAISRTNMEPPSYRRPCMNVLPNFLRRFNARFIHILYGELTPVGDTEFGLTAQD